MPALSPLHAIVVACLAGGVLAIVAAAGTLTLHARCISTPVSFAVGALHAIPPQVGAFAVFRHSGYARRRAFAYNLGTGVATLLEGLAGYAAPARCSTCCRPCSRSRPRACCMSPWRT